MGIKLMEKVQTNNNPEVIADRVRTDSDANSGDPGRVGRNEIRYSIMMTGRGAAGCGLKSKSVNHVPGQFVNHVALDKDAAPTRAKDTVCVFKIQYS